MKKRFKRILNKKGLTLVEILVVLVVSSILLGCAMGMLAPAKNLLNSTRSNAHMDTMCNTVNEYLRGAIEKAEAVSIIMYPDSNSTDYYGDADDRAYIDAADANIKTAWKNYSEQYKASDGYQIRALGIMQNYNGDFRLFDFGDVTTITYSWWGGLAGTYPIELDSTSESDITAGQTFLSLLDFRDGGGRDRTWESPPRSGFNGNEFGWFNAFNEDFYSSTLSGKNNYSIQVAFEAVAATLDDGSTGDVNYMTVSTQMFKRTGDRYSAIDSEKVLSFEPVNQVKSMSFKMLNGNASVTSVSGNINRVETVDGAKKIVSVENANGKTYNENVVILYAVRDLDAYYATP